MKKFFTIAMFSLLLLTSTRTQAQYIPDSIFAELISMACPSCIDANHYLTANAQNLNRLEIGDYGQITDLTGLDGFTNLQTFKFYRMSGNTTTFLPVIPGHLDTLVLRNVHCTNLPPLPSTIIYLDCWGDHLTSLPALPDSLIFLDCRYNNFTSLPPLPVTLQVLNCGGAVYYYFNLTDLPPNLVELDCSGNGLSTLPILPSSLKYLDCSDNYMPSLTDTLPSLISLDCSWNNLTALPALPSTLTSLGCNTNALTTLPPLPSSLTYLDCSENDNLIALPALPSSLRGLVARWCHLINVPVLPDSLTDLDLSYNSITSIPNFPIVENLPWGIDINISYNPISCLPFIPNEYIDINMTGTNITCLPNSPSGYYYFLPLCEAGNLNGCFANPTIHGNTYGDFNNNGVFDSTSEFHAGNVIVVANPGNYIGISDSSGNFKIGVPENSTDTVSILPIPAYYYPPSNYYTVTFDTTSGQESFNNDFGIVAITTGSNLETTLTTEIFRPGFDTKLFVTIRNVGTDDIDGTTALAFDPLLTFVSADQNGMQSGNTVNWNFSGFHPFQTKTFVATINSPANLVLGTLLNNISSGEVTGATDIDLLNNSQSITSTVVGSYDPNDKQVTDAAITMDDLANGKYLEYTIRFQNTGTAPATFINVADTLSDKLDAATFEMIAASHQYNITLANDLTKENHPVFVKWLFNNIQLPDSSVDFAGSQGFVKFRIKPKSDLVVGDEIQNTAGIYFDFNTPVVTNTAITDVVVAGNISIAGDDLFKAIAYPNPAQDISVIHFTDVASSEIELWITDAIGTTVLQGIIAVPHESFDLNLDLQKFPRGLYLINMKSSDRLHVMKLVKD